jgi:hypothetical protein
MYKQIWVSTIWQKPHMEKSVAIFIFLLSLNPPLKKKWFLTEICVEKPNFIWCIIEKVVVHVGELKK